MRKHFSCSERRWRVFTKVPLLFTGSPYSPPPPSSSLLRASPLLAFRLKRSSSETKPVADVRSHEFRLLVTKGKHRERTMPFHAPFRFSSFAPLPRPPLRSVSPCFLFYLHCRNTFQEPSRTGWLTRSRQEFLLRRFIKFSHGTPLSLQALAFDTTSSFSGHTP